jgi:adenosylmethionine-8-amino-7-oxononanoate aminotransferase
MQRLLSYLHTDIVLLCDSIVQGYGTTGSMLHFLGPCLNYDA